MSAESMHSSLLQRGPIPKPAKGSYRAEKLAARATIEYVETRAKATAKRRDGRRCRRPGCATNLRQWRLEAAHLDDKAMGGDHGLRSSLPSDFVSLCVLCHQGERSIHSGDLRMVPLTDSRGDGPVRFDRIEESGWVAIGVSEP